MSETREISSEVPRDFFRPLFLVSGYFCGFIAGAFTDCMLADARQDSYLVLKIAPGSGIVGVVVALFCLVFENQLPRILRDRRRPTLGGLLAIANISVVFAVVIGMQYRLWAPIPNHDVETVLFFGLILPIFWGLFTPRICGGYGFTESAILYVFHGVNAIAWGYLVAAIFKKVQSTRAAARENSVAHR